MRISNNQYLLIAGFFQLLIATTYGLICVSNYEFNWFDKDLRNELIELKIFNLSDPDRYEPALTYGLAQFYIIMFIVYWVIWDQGENSKKTKFDFKDLQMGLIPFGFAIFIYFMVDYRNDLSFVLTGSYAIFTIILIGTEKE
jgi:hypothetical protein